MKKKLLYKLQVIFFMILKYGWCIVWQSAWLFIEIL